MLAVTVGNKFKSLAIHSLQVISAIKVETRLATLSYISKEKKVPSSCTFYCEMVTLSQ